MILFYYYIYIYIYIYLYHAFSALHNNFETNTKMTKLLGTTVLLKK